MSRYHGKLFLLKRPKNNGIHYTVLSLVIAKFSVSLESGKERVIYRVLFIKFPAVKTVLK